MGSGMRVQGRGESCCLLTPYGAAAPSSSPRALVPKPSASAGTHLWGTQSSPGLLAPSLPHGTPRHPEAGGLKFTSLSSPPNCYSFSAPWLEWGTLVDRTVKLSSHLQEFLHLFCSFCKKMTDSAYLLLCHYNISSFQLRLAYPCARCRV